MMTNEDTRTRATFDSQVIKPMRKQNRKARLEAAREAIDNRPPKPDRPMLRKAAHLALVAALPITAAAALSTMGHNKAPGAPKTAKTEHIAPTPVYDAQNPIAAFSLTPPTAGNRQSPAYEVTVNNGGSLSEASSAIAAAKGLKNDTNTQGSENNLDNDILFQLDPGTGYGDDPAVMPGTTVYLYPESPIVNPEAIDKANEQGSVSIKKLPNS